jgi:hypothetical protein
MKSGFVRGSRWDIGTVDLRSAARKKLPFVPALGSDDAIATWRERMIDADGAAREMARLASALFRREHAAHAAGCELFAREERALAVLAGSAVEALGGAAVFHVDANADVVDDDAESPAEWLFRAMTTMALTAVSIATRLGVARALMPSGDLLALVTRMHRTEVRRARFAWDVVAKPIAQSLPFDARVRTAEHLSHVFAETEVRTTTLAGSSAPTSDEELALGFVHGTPVRRAFYRAMKGNVIPKLERAGIRADLAWAGRASIFESISA